MFRLGYRDTKNADRLGHRDTKNDNNLGHRDTKNADKYERTTFNIQQT